MAKITCKDIKQLRNTKGAPSIHADLTNYNGFNVFVFNNEGTILLDKKLPTQQQAINLLMQWIIENSYKNKKSYKFGTIQNTMNLPHTLNVFGELPY